MLFSDNTWRSHSVPWPQPELWLPKHILVTRVGSRNALSLEEKCLLDLVIIASLYVAEIKLKTRSNNFLAFFCSG